ncbi:MAG: PEP-CTERM sorting domain-containing protein [Planctomycetota bacterium]
MIAALVASLWIGPDETRALTLSTGSGVTDISDATYSDIIGFDSAVINLLPGAIVSGNVELDEGADLNMTGGLMGSLNTVVDLLGQSTAQLSGGIVPSDVTVADDASLTLDGAILQSFVDAINNSQVTIATNAVVQGQVTADDTSTVTVTGGVFIDDVAPAPLSSGTVTLNLSGSDTLGLTVQNAVTHGKIQTTAPATIGGTLTLSVDPGFDPTAGTSIEMISFPIASGVFGAMDLANHELPGNMILAPTYSATSFDLVAAMPADFNFDEVVGVPDLIIWAQNFGSGNAFVEGDSDLDGLVGVPDLIRWAQLFGSSPTQGAAPLAAVSAAVAVPEPASLALIGVSAMALTRRPRKKN